MGGFARASSSATTDNRPAQSEFRSAAASIGEDAHGLHGKVGRPVNAVLPDRVDTRRHVLVGGCTAL